MTVKELIERLSKYDPNALVWIEDPETDWYLNINYVLEGKYIIVLGWRYPDKKLTEKLGNT